MNLGWLTRDPESKYIAFLNNGLVIYPLSLREIVEYMESDAKVGAASDLIYYGDGKTVYSARGLVTELWSAGGICWTLSEHECYGKDRPHYVTYADGTYMVVNTEIVKAVACIASPSSTKRFYTSTTMYQDRYCGIKGTGSDTTL
jgi:GT2 family glycosyltransferase